MILAFGANFAMTVCAAAGEAAGVSASASAIPVLVARDFEVVRAGRTLARVEALELLPGDVHVLLGANGAGKSTLLSAQRGRGVARDAEDSRVARSSRRPRDWPCARTAAVFQPPFLLATSVHANVESGLRLRGASRAEARRRAAAALDLLGIAHLAGRKPDKLSGGEAQRVSIARALAVDPAVLFLDEPLGSRSAHAPRAGPLSCSTSSRSGAMAVVGHPRP